MDTASMAEVPVEFRKDSDEGPLSDASSGVLTVEELQYEYDNPGVLIDLSLLNLGGFTPVGSDPWEEK